MRNIVLALLGIAISLEMSGSSCAADNFKVLDVRLADQRLTGRVMKLNEHSCLLLARDGRLRQLEMGDITEFKELSGHFKPHSHGELKKQFETEFGEKFEVRTSNHFVIVAGVGMSAKYSAIFETIYREFVRSFRSRGFHMNEPEFPMAAIVFPDQAAFTKYCSDEHARIQPGVVGVYLSMSNRVAMYERPNSEEIDSTVIHEATHQVAFNTGIHSRLAKHPRWVVEGLATVFESDGVRIRQGTTSPADRINRERYLWFREYASTRRPPHSLKSFLRDDHLFEKSALDAYSEAWALSFFLMETRSIQYSKYLKLLVEREPLVATDSTTRLKDFTDAFGDGFDRMEASYLSFIKRISDR